MNISWPNFDSGTGKIIAANLFPCINLGTGIRVTKSTITDRLVPNLRTNGIVYANSESTYTALTHGTSGYICRVT